MIEILLQAERALSVGLLDRAETLYSQVARADPQNSIAVVGLARVKLDRGDEVGALELARKASAIDPENPAAQNMVMRLEEILEYRDAAALLESGPGQGTVAGALEAVPEVAAEPGAAVVAEPEPEVVAEPEPEVVAEPVAEPETEPMAEAEEVADPEIPAESDAGAEPEAVDEPEAVAEPEPAPDAVPERASEPEAVVEPEPDRGDGRTRGWRRAGGHRRTRA